MKNNVIPLDLDKFFDETLDSEPQIKYSRELFIIESVSRETYWISIKCVKIKETENEI